MTLFSASDLLTPIVLPHAVRALGCTTCVKCPRTVSGRLPRRSGAQCCLGGARWYQSMSTPWKCGSRLRPATFPARGGGEAGRGAPASASATFPPRIGALALAWAEVLCPHQLAVLQLRLELSPQRQPHSTPGLVLPPRRWFHSSPEACRGIFENL